MALRGPGFHLGRLGPVARYGTRVSGRILLKHSLYNYRTMKTTMPLTI